MVRSRRFFDVASVVVLAGLGGAPLAHAATFASSSVSYKQGTVPSDLTQYDIAASAVGAPSGTTGASAGFPGVVSPFNPAFDTDQVVVIGVGGHLELQFASAVDVGTGPALGVFTNAGLIDSNYPNAITTNPASIFGGGKAKVRVSADGVTWVNLGLKSFSIPENYYTNAGAYDVAPPSSPVPADYSKPFTGHLGAFNGEDDAEVIATLNGSAGGKWLNLSDTGLSSIRFIKFTEPTNLPAGSTLAIDAVSVAAGHTSITPSRSDSAILAPSAVPLPSALGMGLLGLVGAIFFNSKRLTVN